ncbi:MAG: diguanylate cyclase, partial [Bilophila sp.]
ISVSYSLLEGISNLPQSGATYIPVRDRAYSLKPFADGFKYWMIGVADPDGTIASTRRYGSAKLERDYIPRILRTQKREMTDIFPAGATGDLNVTQLVPVIRNGKVVSIVFTATLLTEINALLTRSTTGHGYYALVDSKGDIVAHPDKINLFRNIVALNNTETMLLDETHESFQDDIKNHRGGTFFSWYRGAPIYTVYTRLENTNWIILHRVRILPTFMAAIIGFGVQVLIYGVVFTLMYLLGTLYMQRQLQPVDNILKQVVDLNRELLDSARIDAEEVSEIIRISHRGLKDELTGLPTRMLFRQILNARMRKMSTPQLSAIFFIDMDNLKVINDCFGHTYGDEALSFFGVRLQSIATKYAGLCSRYGGDEFLLFVENLDSIDAVHPIAEELLCELRGKIMKDEEEHCFHSSIGIAFYPLHSAHIDVVIQLADIALYETKQRGKDGYTVYFPEISAHAPAPKTSNAKRLKHLFSA